MADQMTTQPAMTVEMLRAELRTFLDRLCSYRGKMVNGNLLQADALYFVDALCRMQLEAAPSPPDGWKLVPMESTDDMQIAFAEVWYTKIRCIDDCEMQDCYKAMLAASPEPPK